MALQFIFGNSGSGKSEYIYSDILEKAEKELGTNFFILVPEQFSIQTQRDFVIRQKRNGILNIDVVSFQRLAFRIFDELGRKELKILEETGKNFVIRKVAEKIHEEFKVLKNNYRKTGYISEIKSVISELTQYRIRPDMLEEFINDEKQNLAFQMKINDINLIYREFLSFIEGNFITAEELLEVLADVIHESMIIKNSVIVLDGFTGFTPVQFHLLAELMREVKDMYVSVTLDDREDPFRCEGMHELFYMSKQMTTTLSKIATSNHMPMNEPIVICHCEESRFKKSCQLLWLEQNLFRKQYQIYQEKVSDITMHRLKDPREEVIFLAEEISRLVREERMRYKDIAIICGDINMYGNYIDEIFEIYQIPRFLDRKKNLLFHPMTEFIRGVLLIVEYDFSYEHVFSYLRCGLSGFSLDEIDLLENYCLANKIRGFSRWNKKWIRLASVSSEEELSTINEIRMKIMEGLKDFYSTVKSRKKSVQEKTVALYQYIMKHDMQKLLKQQEEMLISQGEVALSKEYEQVYAIIMDLFDKFVDLLGEEKMTVREYREILEAGFEAASIGIVPPGYDRVVCGDMERTRLSQIKVLFLAGVNDGFIPKESNKGSILSEQERELLSANHMELAPTLREKNFMQKFYLYLNVTKPSEKLYLTWFLVDDDGKERKQSYLIHTIRDIFPGTPVSYKKDHQSLRQLITPEGSRSFFTEGLNKAKDGEISPIFRGLYQWYTRNEEWAEKIKPFFDAAFQCYEESNIRQDLTRALYGSILENSVTRLEHFCSCAFSHFLSYGLHLKERQMGEIGFSDMGNMFHEAIERYALKMEQMGYQWFDVPEQKKKEFMEDAVAETISDAKNALLFDDARNTYVIERMKRILTRSIEAITTQIQESGFLPEGYEVSFSFAKDLEALNFKLSEQEKMKLKGRIDRLDTKQTKDSVYVKVVDYKSGNARFQLVSVYYGLKLQLVVYMNAAVEMLRKKYPKKEIRPSGMFYYHIEDPVIDGNKDISDEEINQKILDKLKLNGMGCDTQDVSVNKKSQQVDEDQMKMLSKFVNHKIRTVGKEIYKGNIGTNPYMLGDETGCDYCPYHGICGFDQSLPGYGYRRLPEIKDKDEVLTKMQEEVETDE